MNNGAYTRFVYGPNFVQSYSTINNVADEAYAVQVVDGMGRVIASAGNHPGSNGGYRAQMTIYDLMGRAVKTSNPAEISESWVPAGDDVAGWLYTQQTYDWQGRPLVTTNPDLTTREASYGGCGCAGGTVVTLTDEGTVINFAGTIKKRQKKIYSDVLGRTRKVEVLNWDGTGPNGTAPNNSVYSTTVYTYNARDQITQTRQYAGIEGSGTFQDTTISYDGYGRLQSKLVAAQTAATVYTFNADDTLHSVTDARASTATYGYNARHLVTSINYSAPGGITPTANVTLGYDAAGNRTSMTDGVGSRSYNYDQLSRMTSETQSFNGLAGSFPLSYGYNLADQLTSLVESPQFGATVNYAHDSVGRLTAVTGSGGISAQLLTGMQYRAWNGRKHASYGDGPQVNVTYNTRLLPTRYELSNVYLPLITPGFNTVGTENQYHPDGRLRYAHDLQDDDYDRAFTFDHAGRLKEAYTGREARGLAPSWPEDSPYRQSYSYDVWNNMGRTGRHWTLAVSDTPTYTNNRRPDWSYDASGNVTLREGGQRTHSYDAAGRQRHFYEAGTDMWGSYWLWHQYTINQTYDGDGRPGQRIETRYSEDENGPVQDYIETSYQLRSSVLGGALIAKINQWGYREVGHVYAEGEPIADYQGTGVNTITTFQHRNLTTGQWVKAGVRTELDPLGADVGYTSPYAYNMTYSDIMGSDNLYSIRGNALDIRGGCTLDGMSISCNEAMESVRSGTAQEVVLVSHYVVAKMNGQAVFRGYAGTSYVPAADMWRSEITTPVAFTPEQLAEHGDKFKNQSFWTAMLSGSINFNSYGETTYSDDVGTHDISTPYNVNIYGGAAFIGQNPQNPLDRLLEQGKSELKKRITERKSCADVFGGKDKALKALNQLHFKFGVLKNGAIMEITGNDVIVDSDRFNETGQALPLALNIKKSTVQGHPSITYDLMSLKLSGTEFAAFAVGHELGHKRKIFGEYDKDGGSAFSNLEAGANNEKIRRACFEEFSPQPFP